MNRFMDDANEFLKICSEFQLGNLPTEIPNPKTSELSKLSKNDIKKAIDVLVNVDKNVFEIIHSKIQDIFDLKSEIDHTFKSGGRVFLVGCGATGRLSLALETLWRIKHKDNDQVISLMAGGDVALIHSVEKFEDFPEFGERQLMELNFHENDLLIATTEGGETPFVIGATNKASTFSKRRPFFLYCNPDDILFKTTKRSREVIENNDIRKINLTVGPMALTGSTRMQATTILMYVVGLALLNTDSDNSKIVREIELLQSFLVTHSFSFLEKFIERESNIYDQNEFIYYETDGDLGISILTDTTERSPTFSLVPFENQLDSVKNPALSYLLFSRSANSKEAWFDLLKRKPRAFFWPEVTDRTSIERLYGFDFSNELILQRKKYITKTIHRFKIFFNHEDNQISFELNELKHICSFGELSFLSVHILLKMMLNTHSTILMGRQNRYESNLMTWVRASNFKLIDRSVRYAKILLKEKGIEADYNKLVLICYKHKDQIPRDQSLVLLMVDEYQKEN
jgi:N-acetylmuramic acid 6-phosphate etherase